MSKEKRDEKIGAYKWTSLARLSRGEKNVTYGTFGVDYSIAESMVRCEAARWECKKREETGRRGGPRG